MTASNNRVLVSGCLGYHDQNIIEPVIMELRRRGVEVDWHRIDMDFFASRNFENMPGLWHKAVNSIYRLEEYRSIFFADYWNGYLPSLLYRCMVEKSHPRLIGMVHGTVKMSEDLACEIHCSDVYEDYLIAAYDDLVLQGDWMRHLLEKGTFCGSPFERQSERQRPNAPKATTVFNFHRWARDKGSDRFLDLVNEAQGTGIEFIVTGGEQARKDLAGFDKVWVADRCSEIEMAGLCQQGGYAWGDPRSETFGYAIYDAVSYGLTPLLSLHPAYDSFPREFRFSTAKEAIEIVQSQETFPDSGWQEIVEANTNNTRNIAALILG